ncbi:Nrap protein, partial [Blyttiomyces helicus]
LSETVSRLASSGIAVPFPSLAPPPDAQYRFAFHAPTKVFVAGSYLLKTTARTPAGANVDIAVAMPDAVFQEKDNVNHRYFYKRACYLAVIAAELKRRRKDFHVGIEFAAFGGDRRRPVLVLKSTGENPETDFSKLGFEIRIHLTISPTLFPANRLAPSRNNVRLSESTTTQSPPPPTPHYNAAILHDTTLVPHLNLLHTHATACAGFRDACVLARVWLAQRGLLDRDGGFGGFLFAMVIGYLLRTGDGNGVRRIANSYSSYQILKVTMEFLAKHDFVADPIFMTSDGKPLEDKEFSADAFKSAYEVVIVDPTGRVNLAAFLSKAAMDELQYEAKVTAQYFSDADADRFDALFLKKVDDVHLKFDNIARIPAPKATPPSYTKAVALDFPSQHAHLLRFIPSLLQRGLNNRVKLVTALTSPYPAWSCDEEPPSEESLARAIHIGLILDVEHSLRVVEHGPSPDDVQASEAFRALWGDRSELRRFKDGSILESVVFDVDATLEARATVIGKIVAHLLARHMGTTPQDGVTYWASQLDRYLRAPGIQPRALTFQPAMEALASFTKLLRGLPDLPLSVQSVIPCSAGLRYTSVFIPQPRPEGSEMAEGYCPYTDPLDVVIRFESSGRWPDDFEAVQAMKHAFYVRIAEQLNATVPGARALVCKGSGRDKADGGWIEVTIPTGFTFRGRVHHDREALLLERATAAGQPWAADATRSHHTLFIRRPDHSVRIQNLCLRNPFLPGTIRLAKRWIAAHMLSPQVPDEFVELICARLFVDPAPWAVPGSAWVGFLRFLDLFRTWDWKGEPLVVELEKGALTGVLRKAIREKFEAVRGAEGANKGPVAVVATERDTEGVWWGSKRPSGLVVERLRALASAALGVISKAVAQGVQTGIAVSF